MRAVPKPWRRRFGWLAGLALGLLTFTVVGWRCGFSALPDPVPGFVLPISEVVLTNSPLPVGAFWGSVRAFAEAQTAAANPGGMSRNPKSGSPFRTGLRRPLAPPPAKAGAGEWNPDVEQAITNALARPDWRPPVELGALERFGFRRLSASALQGARSAAEGGDASEALRRLALAWQLQSAAPSSIEFPELFDERGDAELIDELAKPFQELAARGQGLRPAELRSLLGGFDALTNRLNRPEAVFARLVARDAAVVRASWPADWRRVRRSFRMAMMLVRQDAGHLFVDLLERALGRRAGGTPNYHGAAHALRPLGELLLASQAALARPADSEQMYAASVGHTFRALREGTLPEGQEAAWLPGAYRERSAWRRGFDRPAAWRAGELLPQPQVIVSSWRMWRAGVEACRVTLALRICREERGRWPESLAELAPAILREVPADPLTGGPLRYGREGEGWWLQVGEPPTSAGSPAGWSFRFEPE